ncbi:receptor-like protein Cf-9 [Capsicum galapagoense]
MGYTQFSFLLFLCFCLLSFSSSMPQRSRHFPSKIQADLYYRSLSLSLLFFFSWDGVTCDEMTGHVIELDLSCSQLVGKIDSNSSLFLLSHLQRLDLSYNKFSGSHISPEFGRFSNLTHLDLSVSSFSGQIPSEISHLSNLQSLSLFRLTSTRLYGIIPESIFNLPSLKTLDLSYNDQLSGYFPKTKWNSSAFLTWLDLHDVNLSGNLLPESLGYLNSLRSFGHVDVSLFSDLKQLSELDLSYNNFSGQVDVSLFSEFKHLWSLDLSYNSITLTNENKINCTWWPESLNTLRLAACQVKEWEFLRSAMQLEELDLSNNNIQGRIPDWEWSNWMFSLDRLNLSHNKLTSVDSIPLQGAYIIDLRSNVPPNDTRFFFISQNSLSGEIPSSICNSTSPQVLDLAANNLHWEFHDVWEISLLSRFWICGVTIFLGIFQELSAMDSVRTIDLRSNELHGSIGTQTIENMFPNLRMLDLSSNAFSGNLPTSLFQHLKAMRTIDQTMMNAPIDVRYLYYQDSVAVITKGLELEVVRILSLYTTIDLSNNKFEGHIPSIVEDLVALRMLNLSHNGLEGHIPPSLGNLSVVESLDLPGNHLVGEILAQFSSLTYLKVLNLSHNNLQGCIPQGPQLATFENNSYEGNDGLRGFPVSKGCGNDHVSDTVSGLDDHESYSEFLNDFWKAALMAYLNDHISIIYMISTRNPMWLARIALKLEHKIITGRKTKQ